MSIIADVTISADRFELGRILGRFPGIEIELERIVPLREPSIPLLWISGADRLAVEAALRDNPQVRDVDVLTTADDETLFEVEWNAETDGLVGALIETRAKIIEASGNAEAWDFRLRFRSHEDLTAFSQTLTDDGTHVTLRHLYNPTIPDETPLLSTEQRNALVQAYRRGYFEVPRRVSLGDIADSLGISDSALSQRLRRGTATLIESALVAEEKPAR